MLTQLEGTIKELNPKLLSNILYQNLFSILESPNLFLFINDTLIHENSVTNLIYGGTYKFKFFANNSRPAVDINVFVNDILADLETYTNSIYGFQSNSISGFQSNSQCDSNLLCDNFLTYYATLNDPSLFLPIKNISFIAFNATYPYDLFTRNYVANINITVPENKTFFSSQQNVVFLNNEIATLPCFSNNSNTTKWYFYHFAYNATDWWLINAKFLYLINDTQPLKYLIDTKNSLSIFDLSQQTDEGYYTCGSRYGTSFLGATLYFLFIAGKFFILFI